MKLGKGSLSALVGLLLFGVAGFLGLSRHAGRSENRPDDRRDAAAPLSRAPAEDASASRSAAGPAAVAATGIAGRVRFDGSGLPVAAASVAVAARGATAPLRVATTGVDGRYRLEGLSPGTYRVRAFRGEWGSSPEDLAADVGVRGGEVTDGIDRRLVPGLVLAGEVVARDSRRPVPGARVGFGFARGALPALAVTDEEGRFHADGVVAGLPSIAPGARELLRNRFWLVVEADGFVRRSWRLEGYPGDRPFLRFELGPAGVVEGTVRNAAGEPVRGVWVGNTYGSDRTDAAGRYAIAGVPLDASSIFVEAAHGRFAARARAPGFAPGTTRVPLDLALVPTPVCRLAGRTVALDGRPLAAVEILVGEEIVATSDARGRFVAERVPLDECYLTARKRGFAPLDVNYFDLSGHPAAREDLELVLEPGYVVTGEVIDTEARPVAGAQVSLVLPVESAPPYRYATSDAGGRFRFVAITRTVDAVAARKEGFVPAKLGPVVAGADDLRLVLVAAGEIRGLVVSADGGAPVHAATVRVTLDSDGSPGRDRVSARVDRCQPGQVDGSFLLRSLDPAFLYDLDVEAPGYRGARLGGVRAWLPSQSRAPLHVELRRGGVLRGEVVSASSGEPLAGVRVHCLFDTSRMGQAYWDADRRSEERAAHSRRTDRQGRFAFDGLGADPAVLLFERDDLGRTACFGVRPAGEVRRFVLPAAAVIAGVLRDARGAPWPGARVRVTIDRQDFSATGAGADGRFRLERLPGGVAQGVIERTGWLRRHFLVETAAGEVATVDLVAGGGALRGRVTRGGQGVAGARVVVTRLAEPAERGSLTADRDGGFRLEGLPPGAYEVSATAAGDPRLRRVSRPVTVDGEVRCDVALDAAGTLLGVVRDRVDGAAVTRGTVVLYREDPTWMAPIRGLEWRRVDSVRLAGAGGGFAFALAEPGSYLLACVEDGEPEGRWGWLGPLYLEHPEDPVTIGVGGHGRLDVAVVDADSGSPVAGATVVLRGRQASVFGGARTTDAAGRVSLARVPPGAFELEVWAAGWLAAHERIDIADDAVAVAVAAPARVVRLERASWLVLSIANLRSPLAERAVLAWVVGGDDPGWPHRDRTSDLPILRRSFRGQALRLEVRPGRYRMRFEVKEAHHGSSILRERELDVAVPARGEVEVEL